MDPRVAEGVKTEEDGYRLWKERGMSGRKVLVEMSPSKERVGESGIEEVRRKVFSRGEWRHIAAVFWQFLLRRGEEKKRDEEAVVAGAIGKLGEKGQESASATMFWAPGRWDQRLVISKECERTTFKGKQK